MSPRQTDPETLPAAHPARYRDRVRTELDHLVWASPDLDALVTHASQRFEVAPVEGGRHDAFGVRNYLLGLGSDRYLELIGPDPEQPKPSQPRPFSLDALSNPRLVGWAVRTSGITRAVTAARAAGYNPGTPRRMARKRPDGTRLEWLLTPPSGGLGGVVPFVIDWLDCEHPSTSLPAIHLKSLTLHHPDPDRVDHALQALQLDRAAKIMVQKARAPGLSALVDCPAGRLTIGLDSDRYEPGKSSR